MYTRSLFIFRQDLRLEDNTALIEAIKQSEEVFPIFIYDHQAVKDFGESDVRFGFIKEALEYIDEGLRPYGGALTVYRGKPREIVEKLLGEYTIDAIYVNRSYSPRGKARDDAITSLCDSRGIGFHSYQDFLMVEPHEVEQRKVFTPFSILWKKFLTINSERLNMNTFDGSILKWFIPKERMSIHESIKTPYHPFWTLKFGRERMERDCSSYDELRNFPAIDGSTRLSPYLRFGIFSVRQVYQKFGSDPILLSELIWREFWYHIAYHFPYIYSLEFQEKRRSILWSQDLNSYEWTMFQEGKTGYPLIDAAIKQLYETNWMHNRLRMVVASFLTKNLGIDWRIGEKWFRNYLIDYDEAVNIGNWQWSASVGADPKRVRIFNPLLQSEKFDREAKFIKQYLPELEGVDPKDIHTLNLKGIYQAPIVDQKGSAARARERYKA